MLPPVLWARCTLLLQPSCETSCAGNQSVVLIVRLVYANPSHATTNLQREAVRGQDLQMDT